MATDPLVTIQDLEKFWRPLNGDAETDRATTLLLMAESFLRQIASNNGLDLDVKIAADSIFKASVKLILLAAVKRAMTTPVDAPPANNWSQAANPYSETIQFTNPSGDLYFKKNEMQLLGLRSISGKSQFGTLEIAR